MNCPPWGEPADLGPQVPIAEAILQKGQSAPVFVALSRSLLENWHRRLFEGRVALDHYAGNVRQEDPQRPCLGRNVAAAGGTGTHYPKVPTEVDALCLRAERGLRAVDRWTLPPERHFLALCSLVGGTVAGFLRIHPFLDGNSRMSRLLMHVMLQRLGLPLVSTVIPPVEPEFSDLKRAAMRGDAGPWAAYLAREIPGARIKARAE